MLVKVGVSNHHIHLNQETYDKLFKERSLIRRNYLGQPTQYATTETLDIKVSDKVINHVRLIGPIRKYNQIEISESDAKILGVNPPRRQSGDLTDSLPVTLIGPEGEVTLSDGLILAKRHIHMNNKMLTLLGLENNQVMSVVKDDKYLFDAEIKASDDGALELHIDIDESELYNLTTGDLVDFRLCGK